MASVIKTVAHAGATGALGGHVLKALLAAGFDVTVLSRSESKENDGQVKTRKVDYDNIQDLTNSLKGIDAVISTVGHAPISAQTNLFDAAIAAGVQRIIPAEFGSDTLNPQARPLPVYKDKVKIQEHIEEKLKGNTTTSYTYILNNAFLDWGISHNFLLNVKDRNPIIYDGGDVPFTATPLPFIGKGVVEVLKHPTETSNRVVRLHGARVTQNQLLHIIQQKIGKKGWTTAQVFTDDAAEKSWANLKSDPGNVMGWAIGFLSLAVFRKGYGGDFSTNNDNKLLGLEELNEEELREVVHGALDG